MQPVTYGALAGLGGTEATKVPRRARQGVSMGRRLGDGLDWEQAAAPVTWRGAGRYLPGQLRRSGTEGDHGQLPLTACHLP